MVSGLFSIPDEALLRASASAEGSAQRGPPFFGGAENSILSRALAAVHAPSAAVNPLVLAGVSGTGKSLLLELLIDEFRRRFGDVSLLITTAVDFARAYAHAVEADAIGEFRHRYSRLHLLAIDDVQRLDGKHAAQQELQQLVDSLVRRGSLVLAALRTHPLDAPQLSYPLASRLAAGLVVPLALPKEAARRAMLAHFAAALQVELPASASDALLSHAAARFRLATAPQLRRAVIGLAELSRRQDRGIDCELVNEYLTEEDADVKSALQAIAAAVGRQLELSVAALRGKSRLRSVSVARSVAMHLARDLVGARYAQIGRYFGNRDHTTVMHACRKTAASAAADVRVRQLLDHLTMQLTAGELGS